MSGDRILMVSDAKKVYKYLKHHGEATLSEISDATGIWESHLIELLGEHEEKKFIDFNPNTGEYSIKFRLGKPLPVHKQNHGAADYGKILQAISRIDNAPSTTSSAPVTTVSGIPQSYSNPYLPNLPKSIDQGDRGTCVGFSTAIATTLAYFTDTQDLPTAAEVAAEQRNVSVNLGCTNGYPAIFDIFEKRWKSPEYLYIQSRLVGNITDPEGSDVGASAKSLTIYGSVFETDDQTSKTVYCVPDWYPVKSGETTAQAQARIIADGQTRITHGYATAHDFNSICAAIYKYGCALIAVNIYENYTTQGCTGNLPDPRGEVVGSHALCLTGYDLNARTMQVRMSWGTDWSDESGFTENYYNLAASECYVILDASEAAIASKLFSTVTLDSNVPCTFVVNNEPTDVISNGNVSLEIGTVHTVTATPVTPSAVVEPSISQSITPTGSTGILNFNFTPAGNVTQKNLIELLVEVVEAIIKYLESSL